ncbi:MAG: type II toxin-antitoxin system RelE/ParE family toxin [Caldilineaceae bacterium]
MRYWLEIPSHVRRQINNLPNHIRPRVQKVIVALRENPWPEEALALDEELTGYYRIKVDIYRIIYTVHEDRVVVEITRVARRDNKTYANLP